MNPEILQKNNLRNPDGEKKASENYLCYTFCSMSLLTGSKNHFYGGKLTCINHFGRCFTGTFICKPCSVSKLSRTHQYSERSLRMAPASSARSKGTDMTEWLISPHWQFKMAQDFRTSKVDVVFLMFRSHPDMGKVKDLQQVESENQTFYRMFLMWRRSVSGALEVVHIAEEESLSMQLTRLVLLVGSVNLSSSESNGLFPKAVMTVARKARRRSEVVFNHTVFHSFVLGSVWGIGNIQIIVWN